jgi:hypothetical protein
MGLENKGNLYAAYRPIITEVEFHGMIGAIEPPRRPFHFRFQESLGVNPNVDGPPVLQGELKFVGISALDLFHASEFNLCALGSVIDQGPSSSVCMEAVLSSSAVKGSTSLRLRNGLTFHPLMPSNTWIAV